MNIINHRSFVLSFIFFILLCFVLSNNSYCKTPNETNEKLFLEIRPVSIPNPKQNNFDSLNKKNMVFQKDMLILEQQVDILTKELNEVKMVNDVNYIKETNKAVKKIENLMIFLILFILISFVIILTYTILLYLKIQAFLQKELKVDVENIMKNTKDDINKQFKERESKFVLYIDKTINKKIKIFKDSLDKTQNENFDRINQKI